MKTHFAAAAPLLLGASLLAGCATNDGRTFNETVGGWNTTRDNAPVEETLPRYNPAPEANDRTLYAHGPQRLENRTTGMCTWTAQLFTRYYNLSSGTVTTHDPDPYDPNSTIRFTGWCNGHLVPTKISVCVAGAGPIVERYHQFDQNGRPLKRQVIGRDRSRVVNCPGTRSPYHLEYQGKGFTLPPTGLFGWGF